MSTGTTIGGTLISGIQEISALLPLLGTEQCEDHIASAHSKGYLYAAVTPMSIFGSLGMVRAGFKALVASCDVPGLGIVGAQKLADMGFKPQGKNLSFIMFDNDKDNHHVEDHMEKIVAPNQLSGVTKVEVVRKYVGWNVTMAIFTGIFSILSIAPYLHLNLTGGSNLGDVARWTFPVLRALGGFLTATVTQIVIQRRAGTLARKYLARRLIPQHQTSLHDAEEGQLSETVAVGDKTDTNSLFTCFILLILFTGILASIAGYIGCFAIVQNTQSKTGPISWLFEEIGLSIIRMILWGLNPTFDDPPPMEFKLELGDGGESKVFVMDWNGFADRQTLVLMGWDQRWVYPDGVE